MRVFVCAGRNKHKCILFYLQSTCLSIEDLNDRQKLDQKLYVGTQRQGAAKEGGKSDDALSPLLRINVRCIEQVITSDKDHDERHVQKRRLVLQSTAPKNLTA